MGLLLGFRYRRRRHRRTSSRSPMDRQTARLLPRSHCRRKSSHLASRNPTASCRRLRLPACSPVHRPSVAEKHLPWQLNQHPSLL